MKQKNIFILVFIMLFLGLFTSCSSDSIGKHDNLARVTFELEGGSYKNSTTPVKHYYDLTKDGEMLIYELSNLTKINLEKTGYELEGWYKTRNEVGGKVTYTDKWNFETDKITKEGVTLYAYWKKLINFTFDVCYLDENNETKVLGSYIVDPDDEETQYFDDVLKYADKRKGYTSVGYVDEEGNPWDNEFVHPCDEENPSVKVYGDYITGEYLIVRDARDLINAANNNVYLMNDIDMEGDELSFGNYKYIFEGNGHTIKNFTIPFSGKKDDLEVDHEFSDKTSIYVSLFGNMENATIRNVTFENATVTINTSFNDIYRIIISPLAINITNSNIIDVSIKGEIVVKKLPNTFIIVNDDNKDIDVTKLVYNSELYINKDENSVVDKTTVDMKITNDLK